jgi:cytochrome c oxidase subunit III
MFTLLFIMMLISITVAALLIRRLPERPWAHIGVLTGSQDGLTSSAPKVGLWAFLGVVTSLFLIFTAAYFMRLNGAAHAGIPSGMMHAWVPVGEPALLWVNTVVLVLASVSMQMARNFAGTGGLQSARSYFAGAGLLTVVFLVGQVGAWLQLRATGHYDHTNPAFAFFVLLTAVHGLHLVGGLVVVARTAGKLWRGLEKASVVQLSALRQSVELCTTYWHYLLLVWLGLFILLLST